MIARNRREIIRLRDFRSFFERRTNDQLFATRSRAKLKLSRSITCVRFDFRLHEIFSFVEKLTI